MVHALVLVLHALAKQVHVACMTCTVLPFLLNYVSSSCAILLVNEFLLTLVWRLLHVQIPSTQSQLSLSASYNSNCMAACAMHLLLLLVHITQRELCLAQEILPSMCW
jgi:hypothetical protein